MKHTTPEEGKQIYAAGQIRELAERINELIKSAVQNGAVVDVLDFKGRWRPARIIDIRVMNNLSASSL